MKILVVYYSRDGHTRAVAQEIARKLGAEIEEIVDRKNRRGFFNWFLAGRDAAQKRLTEIGPLSCHPGSFDLVIIGTPVWAWNMTPAVRTYLTQQGDRIQQAAFFCTQGGSGGAQALASMAELWGRAPRARLELNARELAGQEKPGKIDDFVSQLRT